MLTAKTEMAKSLFDRMPLEGNSATKKLADLGRRIQSPAGFGSPRGRYWFLPGFLAMPDLYVDFLQLESVEYKTIVEGDGEDKEEGWRTFAVLDAPFAEALQSCFVGFYSVVGLPTLDPNRYWYLLPPAGAAAS